jgi:hypothetical protein
MVQLARRAREAIREGTFAALRDRWVTRFESGEHLAPVGSA